MNDQIDLGTPIDLQLLQDLVVGIGEVSDITGIPQRKLRYWEDRGIIESMGQAKGANRRYDYLNIKKILLIKDMLDTGYTLEAANRIVAERMMKINEAFQRLVDSAISPEPMKEGTNE